MIQGPYDIRKFTLADLPDVWDVGRQAFRRPKHQDLLNMGFIRIGNTDYYETPGVFDDGRGMYKKQEELPGVLIAAGRDRHQKLPKELKQKLLRARVYRHKDKNVSLRHKVNDNQDPLRLSAKTPATGQGSSRPASTEHAEMALIKAQALFEEGDVDHLLVPMEEVEDGDVVISDFLPPHSFAGE